MPLAELQAALAKIDDAIAAAKARAGAAITCARGCAQCCVEGLSVLPVEAALIEASSAAPPTRATPGMCAFLDERGDCTIYPVRPVLCRTHGLALKTAPDAARASTLTRFGQGPRKSELTDDRGRGARGARRRRGPERASSMDVTRGPETATPGVGMHRPRARSTRSFEGPCDVEVCRLNYTTRAPAPAEVLDATRVLMLLVTVDRRFRARVGLPDDDGRVALAELADRMRG